LQHALAIAHWVAQFAVVGVCVAVPTAAWRNLKDGGIEKFGSWHCTPPARIWDALAWGSLQFKARHAWRCINALVHLTIVSFVPVAAVLFTNGAVLDHPIAFGAAGLVAGVLAEWPEGRVRNARYGNSETRPESSFAKVALRVGAVELVGTGLLYYLVFRTHVLNETLSAVILGVAFVACAEAMSTISTLWLVVWNGSPFKLR
jgi:hypothetical protein